MAAGRGVVSLQAVKDARVRAEHQQWKYTAENAKTSVLDVFDRMTHSVERPKRDARAEVERLNRKRL